MITSIQAQLVTVQRILFACLQEQWYAGFPGEDSLPKALSLGAEVKLLSLPPSGAQKMQGCAKCILLAGFPCPLLEIFIEVPHKGGGWGKNSLSNILWVAGVAFMLRHRMSLGAPVRIIIKLICQFQCDISYVSVECFLDYNPQTIIIVRGIFLENKGKHAHPTPTSELFSLL